MSVPRILGSYPRPFAPSPPVEPIAERLKEARLQRDDFEILKVIGRGAFSEVSLEQRRQLSGVRDLTFPAVGGMLEFRKWGLRN